MRSGSKYKRHLNVHKYSHWTRKKENLISLIFPFQRKGDRMEDSKHDHLSKIFKSLLERGGRRKKEGKGELQGTKNHVEKGNLQHSQTNSSAGI